LFGQSEKRAHALDLDVGDSPQAAELDDLDLAAIDRTAHRPFAEPQLPRGGRN
jgi:hypothetical protein